jgi:murein DD-endopeptidase MepM/ murein hydrolase activator NlpD
MARSPRILAPAGGLGILLLLALQTASSNAQETPVINWAPPLEPPIALVNLYRQPNSDYSAGHRGIDYQVTPGQSVLAPADGQVWFAGTVVNRPVLSVRHPDGTLSEFEPVCTDLKKGEPIFLGQEIGEVCEAGNTYRAHCDSNTCMHFSIRVVGEYLSPQVFIGGLNPSRLLAQSNNF